MRGREGTARRAGPSAVPVHGELGDQGDIRVVRSRLVLIVQEVQVGPVDGETLPPELVTQVVLVQLGELLLQLKHRRGGLGTEGRPGGAQGPAPRALSLSPLDAAGGQTQKGSLAVFIFPLQFSIEFQKGDNKGQLWHDFSSCERLSLQFAPFPTGLPLDM